MIYVIYSRKYKGFVKSIRSIDGMLQVCAYTTNPNSAYKTTKESAMILAKLCNGTVFEEVV
jgi:hypothetical protein